MLNEDQQSTNKTSTISTKEYEQNLIDLFKYINYPKIKVWDEFDGNAVIGECIYYAPGRSFPYLVRYANGVIQWFRNGKVIE